MSKKTYTTHELTGKHLIDPSKDKRIGKVRHFIFHPTEKRVLGITVKRPDAALMFHRKDVFLALDAFAVKEGEAVLTGALCNADRSVEAVTHVSWDDCVLWVGMPVMTESGSALGFVDNVRFDRTTGDIVSFTTENGRASDVLLGTYTIPGDLIRGFKRGKDACLTQAYVNYNDTESIDRGCVLVSDDALNTGIQGGVAAAAGRATAVVAHKAKQGGKKAKACIDEKMQEAKPTLDKAARKTGQVLDNGAYALGKQLGKTTGMFSAFKEEFKKAVADDDEESE